MPAPVLMQFWPAIVGVLPDNVQLIPGF